MKSIPTEKKIHERSSHILEVLINSADSMLRVLKWANCFYGGWMESTHQFYLAVEVSTDVFRGIIKIIHAPWLDVYDIHFMDHEGQEVRTIEDVNPEELFERIDRVVVKNWRISELN